MAESNIKKERAETVDLFWIIPSQKHAGRIRQGEEVSSARDIITYERKEDWTEAASSFDIPIDDSEYEE